MSGNGEKFRFRADCSDTQLCLTLCDPTDCSPPGSSVHGFPRQEYWSGLPFPTPGAPPNPETKPASPSVAGRLFSAEPQGNEIIQRIFLSVFSISLPALFVIFLRTLRVVEAWYFH